MPSPAMPPMIAKGSIYEGSGVVEAIRIFTESSEADELPKLTRSKVHTYGVAWHVKS